MPESDTRASPSRSFCGKDKGQVRRLIAGPNCVHICDECVRLCVAILETELTTS